jgi:hypothetical protein
MNCQATRSWSAPARSMPLTRFRIAADLDPAGKGSKQVFNTIAVPLLLGRDTLFSRHVEGSRGRGVEVEMSRPARV